MLIACICNPIFINTFVVFIRLYWFEKRFQNVVLEARSLRRNKTKSRTRSEGKPDLDERDIGNDVSGVGDRSIVVLRGDNGHAKGQKIEDEELFREEGANSSSNGASSNTVQEKAPTTDDDNAEKEPASPATHRNIMFADGINPPIGRLPEKLSKEQTIAFVENQRNPKDGGALRIPGPRDFDLGFVPQRITEEDDKLEKETTREGEDQTRTKRRSNSVPPSELNQDDHPFKAHITIDIPEQRQRPITGPSAYTHERGRRGSTDATETPSSAMGLRNRARSRTFGSYLSREREEDSPMPYLSWTPTVGRNSAFVDLTEEQREELGGIEYRSLKLLALILVCKWDG
jgi:hypothetical protein